GGIWDQYTQINTRPPVPEKTAGTVRREPEAASPVETDFIRIMVEGNQRARSWREKLDFVRSLVAERAGGMSTGQWIDLAIYLRFLGAGEIPCVEDGRHFRPSHHAKISIQIQDALARLTTPENAFII